MNKVVKSTVGIMLVMIMSKLLGFVRELILGAYYGASMYSDAYIISMNIPVVIFTTIGMTLNTVLIPMYFEVKNDLGEEKSLIFINNILNVVVIICILLSMLGLIFSEEIIKIFAIGFEGDVYNISLNFTKITIIGIVFTGLSYLMTSYLQINNSFIISGIITIPKNLIIIGAIILSIKYNPYIMIWGVLIGTFSEFLFQLPFAIKKGYKYLPYINLKDKYIKKMAYLILPVLIGVAVNQVNTMIDRTLASTLAEGSVSALNYANKLNGFVMALFITSVGTVTYPILSKLSKESNKEEFIICIVKIINFVILLIVPIAVGAIVLATPIVKILFERGAFDHKATSMTSTALIMYSLGMIGFGIREILGKIFYSLQDTRTPMKNGIIAIIINIIFNFILIKHLKIAGLALSTSISAIGCIFLLFKSLKKKIGYFGQDKIIKTTLKSIISSIVMGIVTYFAYDLLNAILGYGFIYDVISLSGSIVLGSVVYGVLVVILKVEEVNDIVDILKKKIKIKQ